MEPIMLLMISQAVGWFMVYLGWRYLKPHESRAPVLLSIMFLISSFFFHACQEGLFCLNVQRYDRVFSKVSLVVMIAYYYWHRAPLHDDAYDAGDQMLPRGPRPA